MCHKQFDGQVKEEPVFLDENLYAENACAVMSQHSSLGVF